MISLIALRLLIYIKLFDLESTRSRGLNSLKDKVGLVSLNFLSHSRFVRQLHLKARNPGLELSSKRVVTPIVKH